MHREHRADALGPAPVREGAAPAGAPSPPGTGAAARPRRTLGEPFAPRRALLPGLAGDVRVEADLRVAVPVRRADAGRLRPGRRGGAGGPAPAAGFPRGAFRPRPGIENPPGRSGGGPPGAGRAVRPVPGPVPEAGPRAGRADDRRGAGRHREEVRRVGRRGPRGVAPDRGVRRVGSSPPHLVPRGDGAPGAPDRLSGAGRGPSWSERIRRPRPWPTAPGRPRTGTAC